MRHGGVVCGTRVTTVTAMHARATQSPSSVITYSQIRSERLRLEGTMNRNYDFRVSVVCVELVRVGAGGFEGGMQDARGT
jgi:hypothetical protein